LRDFPSDLILLVGHPALRDFPSDLILLVGHKPEVRLRRIEDLKRGTNKDIKPKDIFEMGSRIPLPSKPLWKVQYAGIFLVDP